MDPQAAYIKQWLPELAHLEIPHIYAPWQAPLPLLASHYPPPIIDHSQARKRAPRSSSQLPRVHPGGNSPP